MHALPNCQVRQCALAPAAAASHLPWLPPPQAAPPPPKVQFGEGSEVRGCSNLTRCIRLHALLLLANLPCSPAAAQVDEAQRQAELGKERRE